MKTFISFVLLSVVPLLVSCNGVAGSSTVTGQSAGAGGVQDRAEIPFLKKLGVDLGQVTWLTDKPFSPFDKENEEKVFSFSGTQQKALLEGALHYDLGEDNKEGSYCLTAVRQLPGDYTLAVLHVAFGDVGDDQLAVYDSEGRMTDFVQAGSWFPSKVRDQDATGQPVDMMTMTQGHVRMTGDSDFEVVTTRSYLPCKEVDYELQPAGDAEWTEERCIQYSVDDVGHILYVDTKVRSTGSPTPLPQLQTDFGTLYCQPMSDLTRFDRLNDLVARADVVSDMAQDGQSSHSAMRLMSEFYEKTPQELLTWMAANKGSRNHLLPFFKNLFDDGWVSTEVLAKNIGMMKDAAARKYVEHLTAPWMQNNDE